MKALFRHWRKGDIILWYGAIADIRKGWALCDGNNGTPNLNGKFVPCAGVLYDPGDTGGSREHNHIFTGDGHFHAHQTAGLKTIQSGTDIARETTTRAATGTTSTDQHLPSFHALCYIMKL